MTTPRPPMVGLYELLLDFDGADASVRVFRLKSGEKAVGQHVHRHTNQTYVALEGRVAISRGDEEVVLAPYEAATVSLGTPHGARALEGDAVVMNISVPPLSPDDQQPV